MVRTSLAAAVIPIALLCADLRVLAWSPASGVARSNPGPATGRRDATVPRAIQARCAEREFRKLSLENIRRLMPGRRFCFSGSWCTGMKREIAIEPAIARYFRFHRVYSPANRFVLASGVGIPLGRISAEHLLPEGPVLRCWIESGIRSLLARPGHVPRRLRSQRNVLFPDTSERLQRAGDPRQG